MKTVVMQDVETLDDARLVQLGREGDRDAFGQLVARYQAPVCALAYSACGNLSHSEDLAQETFIVAWRQLRDLKEPAKFKSWLYGIARNLINSAFRRQTRNPLAAAEPLDDSLTTTLSTPAGQAISKEEEGILWRSLENIPETYREPLVLFYREHQSIERVAEIMDLSEEAARQRLSRGRKLLQEQVLAFVEGTLERTNPGPGFTLGVLATLPALTFSAKAATVGAAATKSSATATTAGSVGLLGAILFPVLVFLNLFRMWHHNHKTARSDRERKVYAIFYPVLAASIVVTILLINLLMAHADSLIKTRPSLFVGLTVGVTLGYLVLLLPLCFWFRRAIKKSASGLPPSEVGTGAKQPFWEYRSRFQLLGLPFIHLRTGGWQCRRAGELKPVKAWIAADDAFAFGVLFAYGAVAVAPVSIGACAIGLFSYGAMAFGALAVGGFGFGIWAFAVFGFGWQVSAGCAIAWDFASGAQYAIAHHYALAPTAHAAQANNDLVKYLLRSNPFFQACWKALPCFDWLMWLWCVPLMFSMLRQFRLPAAKRPLDKQPSNP